MPISRHEFENGKPHGELEEEIISFLNERKDKAFTSQEIMEGIRYHTEFSTPEISKMSTFTIADFSTFLHHLVEKGRIKMKIVRGRMYVMAMEKSVARCPKCGTEIPQPQKTWKMTGRPNKKGEALQLQIGFFQCPKHGAFRAVLGKQKILALPPSRSRREKKPKPIVKKRAGKKTATKKTRKRKAGAWLLV